MIDPVITPDGYRYLTAASNQRVARPFHLRWLLPKLLGVETTKWVWASRVSVALLAPLFWWYTKSPWMMACVFLPGVSFNWRRPVLVDGVAMMLTLLAACLWPVFWPAAIVVVLIAAMVRETTPVWAAVWAWHPLLLVGLVPVGIRWLMKQGPDPLGEEHAVILSHPLKTGLAWHAGTWTDPLWMLAPWAGLVLGLAIMDPWTVHSTQLAIALALGYGQLLVATDQSRLYQWAAPSVALACVLVLPPAWLPLVALSILFNPTKAPRD